MDERDKGARVSPEIYVYATNKNFVNVYDALRIDKVKIEIAGYDPATNRQTGHASAWLDKDDARLLTHLISYRLFAAVTGGKWERYGGSQRDDGSVESRTLLVEWDEGENSRFARFPYRITIANGPGKRNATGGVAPAGEPTARLSMRVPEADMMKLMLALGHYIQAYDTAHHHRLVAQKVRDLRDKLAERAGRNGFGNGNGNGYPEEPDFDDREQETRPRTGSTAQPVLAAAQPGRPPLRAMPGGGGRELNRQGERLNRIEPARAG